MRWALFPFAAALAFAQPPAPPPDDLGTFKIPPAMKVEEPKDANAPKPEEETKARPVFTYAGKPIGVPFSCTESDMSTFGMTCTEEDPCPIYTELTGLQPVGVQLFLTGNFHNGASTMYSLFLASEDTGKTWYEAFERVPKAGLDQVQFVDFETGWVSGQILESLPRDPFFLLTTDGGKSWRRRNVFSDSRIATIEQFHFDSKNSGSLLIDRGAASETGARYERYDSQTGGESWQVREVSSKPLKLAVARAATSNPDWRLRADGKLGIHIIEKRTGTRWERISAFQVKAGECNPKHELGAPPPPVEAVQPSSPAPRPAGATKPRPAPTLKKQ
jgi:hypothetical protein